MYLGKDALITRLGQLFENRKEKGKQGLPVLSVTMDAGLVPRESLDRKMAPNLAAEQSLLVEPHDVVYNMMRMWQGAIGVSRQKGVVSPSYVVCRPKSSIDSEFAYYFFKAHPILHRLKSYSFGITGDRLRLYFDDFAAIPVAIPPLHAQRKIVELLSTWDEAIVQTNELIKLKELTKRVLMENLLTGKSRLSGFNKPWRQFYLSDLFDERCETDCGHLPLLAITGKHGVILASDIARKDSSREDKSRYKRIKPGDIGYNTMRMWQGVSAVSQIEGIVSPAYTVCIPQDSVNVDFIGYYFKCSPIINLFWRYSQGLVDDTLNLKFHNFSQIKVTIPNVDEQSCIAQILSTACSEMRTLRLKLEAFEKQKRGLMQRLLTGEVRVKV